MRQVRGSMTEVFCPHNKKLPTDLGIAACEKCWKAYIESFLAGLRHPWIMPGVTIVDSSEVAP